MQAAFARWIRCSQVSRNRMTCLVPEAQQRRVVNSHASVKNTKRCSSSKSTPAKYEQSHAQRKQSPQRFPAPLNKARANSSLKPKSKLEPQSKLKPGPKPEKTEYIHSDTPTVDDSRFDFDQPNPRKKPRSPIPSMEGDTFSTDTAAGISDLLKNSPVNDAKALFGILAGWVLRHEARNMGYGVAPDGFVRVSDVLRFPPFSTYSIAEFGRLIESDEKDRFEMARLPDFIEGVVQDAWWVRARHMHSIPGVSKHNKRVLKTEKLQIVEYRTQLENWNFIRTKGIPQDENHLIRLHRPPGKGLFLETIPDQTKVLSVTIDCQKAVQLGVMFYNTTDVTLYAVGTREKGVIPFEACRSAVILDVSKETLK